MDKLTDTQAVELLRYFSDQDSNAITSNQLLQIAALIESQEAAAAAMREALEFLRDQADRNMYRDVETVANETFNVANKALSTAAGSSLLAAVRAAAAYRQAQTACVGSDDSQHFINRSRAGKVLDATLAACREVSS